MTVLVTGGAGFIGSNFVHHWLASTDEPVVNLDALTYAGSLNHLARLAADPRHRFVHGDVRDVALLTRLFAEHRPRAVIHLAAESHVDRSIHGPADFIHTNVVGTFTLLEAARTHWATLAPHDADAFRFVHVSTDEVYGSLPPGAPAFTEAHPYQPSSPYSASKAGADHLVHAWSHTYGLPVIVTHCSNNYGPRQFPEKLIPRLLTHALAGEPLPVYGDGQQVRDWLFVDDHNAALRRVLDTGRVGERYHIGARCERTNLDVVRALCGLLDELRPRRGAYADLITFVTDRPGHDRRYAMDPTKLETELGWRASTSFADGLRATVSWYLNRDGEA